MQNQVGYKIIPLILHLIALSMMQKTMRTINMLIQLMLVAGVVKLL